MVNNDESLNKIIIVNVGDWTMPAFEGHFFCLPNIKAGVVVRLERFIGSFSGLYNRLIDTDLLFIGGTGGSSHSKRNSAILIKGQCGEDVRILGSNYPPLSRWQYASERKLPPGERQDGWHYWPVTNALYVPGVKSIRKLPKCVLRSNTATIVSAVESQAHYGPGVIASRPRNTEAWVLEASSSKFSLNNLDTNVPAAIKETFSAGAYVRGVLNLAFPGKEAVAFSRAVLYRLTNESETGPVVQEVTRSRLNNPYGLSACATAFLGDGFVSEGMRQIEEHFRNAGWLPMTISKFGHLLTESPRRRVLKGQRLFAEALHAREISRLVTAELTYNTSK